MNRLFTSMMVLGCSLGFVACNDDDEGKIPPSGILTTEEMYGDYDGKMLTLTPRSLANEEDGDSPLQGVDVVAKVANDTIYFDNLPIKDLVLSIVGDEGLADQIVEAVGEVDYCIGYKPALNETRDSILFTLDPKPLKLSVNLPSDAAEGEPAEPLAIEVKVSPAPGAGYEAKSTRMSFRFRADEVLLGEGEEQAPLPTFTPTTFDFDLSKSAKK